MKKILAWAGLAFILAGAGALAFRLFEPVFVYNAGWRPLPKTAPAARSETNDQAWTAQAPGALAALEQGRHDLQAPAVSAAVAIDGHLVWRGVVGYADIEALKPADFDTRFRLGSTSKAVTSVAAGTLIDQGRLDVDQPIQTYVPNYPQQAWPMTLKQVMSHRAGIRDYGLCLCFPIWEHLNTHSFAGVDEEVGRVAHAPLLFKPGTDFRYTSMGYNLVGAAIEHASGEPFSAYVERAVFKPLGMTESGLDTAGAAGFYETRDAQYARAFPVDNSIRWPSGGFLSTPSDMVKLGDAMLDDELLSAKTRSLLVTVPADGGASRGAKVYALGWRHSPWTLYDGRLKLDSYHHAGTAVGSTSVFVVLPERHIVLSVMMNKGGEDVDGLSATADRILQAFIPDPGTPPTH